MVVMQPKTSGSNVVTIYDPDRENRILINQSMRILTFQCTIRGDCY
jgi:hypothetical protein